jgi:hypothetical protein
MPCPELLVPPGTQGQKIEPRSGKHGPCLEEGPVLGPISGGRFWDLFPNREEYNSSYNGLKHKNLLYYNRSYNKLQYYTLPQRLVVQQPILLQPVSSKL